MLLLISWSSVAIEGASTGGKRRCTRILQSGCAWGTQLTISLTEITLKRNTTLTKTYNCHSWRSLDSQNYGYQSGIDTREFLKKAVKIGNNINKMHIDSCIPHTGLNSYCAILNSAFFTSAEAEKCSLQPLRLAFSLPLSRLRSPSLPLGVKWGSSGGRETPIILLQERKTVTHWVLQQGMTLCLPLFSSLLVFISVCLVKMGKEKSRGSQRLSQPEFDSVCVFLLLCQQERRRK